VVPKCSSLGGERLRSRVRPGKTKELDAVVTAPNRRYKRKSLSFGTKKESKKAAGTKEADGATLREIVAKGGNTTVKGQLEDNPINIRKESLKKEGGGQKRSQSNASFTQV